MDHKLRVVNAAPYYRALRKLMLEVPPPGNDENRQGILDAFMGYTIPVVACLGGLGRPEYSPVFFHELTDDVAAYILHRLKEHEESQPKEKEAEPGGSRLERFF